MFVRSELETEASARPPSPADAGAPALGAMGLVAVSMFTAHRHEAALTFVAELDAAAIARVRREALALHAREAVAVTIELRYVADARATALVAALADLTGNGIRVLAAPVGGIAAELAHPSSQSNDGRVLAAEAPTTPRVASEAPATPRVAGEARVDRDPFGLDRALRARALPFFRFMFERYWRIDVSGIEHVPTTGPALVVANHSGAVPADAFMLATALELRHREPRALRVLYDKFVDELPLVGDLYRRLGAVSASLANAECLLARGELVGLFPEGIAGVEKLCTDRYQLRPFKSGTARMSLRTGSPIVPVAIVGAEEAYPVVARLYRAGRLVGLPWIPVTPLFPVCGLAGALPLPTRWFMHFCAPIMPPPPDGRSEDERIAALTSEVRAAIADGLRLLLAKRPGIFV